MNDHDSMMVRMEAMSAVWNVQDQFVNTAECLREPAVLYKPKVFIDGDKWCALYGDDLQNGVCGFGDSPRNAMIDFNRAWDEKITVKESIQEVIPGTRESLDSLDIKK